jgi:cytoskeletal protein RodZ
MNTIGGLLKDARVKKRYSLARVETETKIKKDFIKAVEEEDWQALPDYPVVVGFVKNIANYLGLKEPSAVALLRRDYPPQKLSINPKPDVSKQLFWSPKMTFLVGVGIVIAVILGYLGFQYAGFISPPPLSLSQPQEGQIVGSTSVTVSGKTNPEATVKANNQPILVNEDGTFTAEVEIFKGTSEIVVTATSRSGKETTLRRNIKPEL